MKSKKECYITVESTLSKLNNNKTISTEERTRVLNVLDFLIMESDIGMLDDLRTKRDYILYKTC